MPFIGLSLFISVLAIVHVIKTGRSQLWIGVLLALPGVGAIAYFAVEILPELSSGPHGHAASTSRRNLFSPNKTLAEARREYEIADTVENACNLADALLDKKSYSEASELYHQALKGIYKNNPDIMYKQALCSFGLKNYETTRETLDDLIANNPDYKNQDAHLLYARTLTDLGQLDKATDEYETLITYYTGPEPTYRYGLLLKSRGMEEEARKAFTSILDKSSKSPAHYRRMHRQWIDLANKELYR